MLIFRREINIIITDEYWVFLFSGISYFKLNKYFFWELTTYFALILGIMPQPIPTGGSC